MLDTDYLYRDDMIEQCESACELLATENAAIEELETQILSFVNDEQLISRKVNGAKAHFYDYYLLLEMLKEANNKDAEAFKLLQSEIENNVPKDLCGDVIIAGYNDAHDKYLSANETADKYLTWANNPGLQITNLGICATLASIADGYRKQAKIFFDLAMEFKNEMILYDTIESTTATLFPGEREERNIKMQAVIEELAVIYQGGMFHINEGAGWRPQLSEDEKEKYENYKFYVTGEQLKEMGWKPDIITDEMVDDLNNVLEKYEIDTPEEIAHFLGQCMHETGSGRSLTEDGSAAYFMGKSYDIKYRGSGYIHITFEYGYQAFATYLILEQYPQLVDNKTFYVNPECNGYEKIEDMYNRVLEKAAEEGLDISEYTKMVDEGAEYLATNYAWASAGYIWDIKGINGIIEQGATSDDVSREINFYDTSTFAKREACYETAYKVLTGDI